MKPGIYRGIPNDMYHGGPGISKSGLDLIRKSPAHYRAVVNAANDNEERKPTLAQFIGTALHCLVLEPGEFVRTYTRGLSRSDVPDAIDDREVLVAKVQELNAGRLPKLPTSGSKADLVARITDAYAEDHTIHGRLPDWFESAKGTDLKAEIERLNTTRQGLLPVSGTRHELAQLLAGNGVDVVLWSDVQAEWLRNNGHRQVLTNEQWEQLHNMRDAIEAHPKASRLLKGDGEAELSAYWMQTVRDPSTGEVIDEQLCRVRPDYLRKDGIIVDVKTTEDASEEGFAKSMANYAYHVQDNYYRRGVAAAIERGGDTILEYNAVTGEITEAEPLEYQLPRAFIFIAVEKTACVVDGESKGVAVYTLDEESQAIGAAEWRRNLAVYTGCQKSGKWPGYSPNIRQIKLPAWQFKKAADQLAAE